MPPAPCGSNVQVIASSPSSWTHRRCGPCGPWSSSAGHARAGPLRGRRGMAGVRGGTGEPHTAWCPSKDDAALPPPRAARAPGGRPTPLRAMLSGRWRRRTIVPQTPVSADLLEALQILTQLHVEGVGHHLAELAVLDVLLTVKHPIRHLELARVLDDRHQTLNLLLRQLTSPAKVGSGARVRRFSAAQPRAAALPLLSCACPGLLRLSRASAGCRASLQTNAGQA